MFRQRESFIDRDRATRDPIGQRFAFDEFQHQRLRAVCFLDPVNACDVRMVETGKNFGFPLEPGQPLGVGGEGLRQELEGDVQVAAG